MAAGQFDILQRALPAIFALFVLWAFNEIYFKICQQDAFGMGDAKWSGVAVFAFGLKTVFWTWCVGAWLGLAWMGARKLLGFVWPPLKPEERLHFTPFLFLGLWGVIYITSRL